MKWLTIVRVVAAGLELFRKDKEVTVDGVIAIAKQAGVAPNKLGDIDRQAIQRVIGLVKSSGVQAGLSKLGTIQINLTIGNPEPLDLPSKDADKPKKPF